MVAESDKIVELKQLYDAGNKEGVVSACESIGENYNANQNCTLTFEVPVVNAYVIKFVEKCRQKYENLEKNMILFVKIVFF